MIPGVRFILYYLLLIVTMGCMLLTVRKSAPHTNPLAYFPTICRDWRMTSQEHFSDDILAVLKPTDYLSRRYEAGNGTRIGLYIGYHDGGRASGDIHSPKNCLPGSGWQQLSSERIIIKNALGPINLVQAVYQKGENRELFLYWFQVQEKTMSDEYSLKVTGIINSIMHGRTESSFIRISVPIDGDEHDAAATGLRFVRDVYPLIREFLPV